MVSLYLYFHLALQKKDFSCCLQREGEDYSQVLTSAAGIEDHQGDGGTSHEEQQDSQPDGHKAPGLLPRFGRFFHNIHLTF